MNKSRSNSNSRICNSKMNNRSKQNSRSNNETSSTNKKRG